MNFTIAAPANDYFEDNREGGLHKSIPPILLALSGPSYRDNLAYPQRSILTALTWSQEISTSQGEATTLLRLKCVPKPNCEVGSKLHDYEISLGIAPGEPLAEQLQGRNLQTDAVGGLWFLKKENIVHGWFYIWRAQLFNDMKSRSREHIV